MNTRSLDARCLTVILLVAVELPATAQLDPTLPTGDYPFSATVLNRNGSPAAGLPFTLKYRAQGVREVDYATGTIPDDGVLRIENLPGGINGAAFSLFVGEDRWYVGRIEFPEHDRERDRTLEYMLPPVKGDVAPDITVTELFTRRPLKISDFRGRVLYVDLWASWCPPCQKPMQENHEAMTRHGEDWRDRALILSVSLDNTINDAERHIQKKGWTAIRNTFAAEGPPGEFSDAAVEFVLSDIPTAVLIDPEGRIAWRGNPNDIDVVQMIHSLLEHAHQKGTRPCDQLSSH